MQKVISATAACLLLVLSAFAQDFDHYQPLKSSGPIPESFITLTKEKVDEDIRRIDQDQKRRVRKNKEEFVLVNNYIIDQLLLSGRVLYNDPIGNYINKVADLIIAANPEIVDKDRIRIYAVKSTVVNAFAYDNGSIFINIGLIAQLENEAQLAYILSHELVHFQKRHAINSYVEYDRISQGKNQYRHTSMEDKILAQSIYSKDLELEADRTGLGYLGSTTYDPNEVYGVFDVLQYSFLPFDDVVFPKSYFETKYLKLPDDYFMEETAVIEVKDDYDDSKSTHPNVKTRREAVEAVLNLKKLEGKDAFLVSEKEFKKVRDLARFELCRLYLQSRDYANAIYAAFLLQRDYPNSTYLKEVTSIALYNLTVYRAEAHYEFKRLVEDPEDMQGSSQQLNFLLRKLSKEELNVMALRYVWDQKEAMPDNPIFASMADSLVKSLVFETKLTLDDFSEKSIDEFANDSTNEESAIDTVDFSGLSKYEKIKLRQKLRNKEEKEGEFSFTRYAFVDLLKDEEFTSKFKEYQNKKEASGKEDDEDDWGRSKKKVSTYKKRKKLERKGASLGIDKIVLVDPFYLKTDSRKKNVVQFVKSELKQLEFSQINSENAKLAGLDVEVIDPNAFVQNDSALFNDYSMLNEWIRERFAHEDHDEALVSNYEQAAKLIDKYGTPYFMWTGLLTTRYRKPLPWGLLGLSMFLPLTPFILPYTIYYIAQPDFETYYYTLLFDLRSGQVQFFNSTDFDATDRSDLVNSFIYDTYYQIHKSK